MEKFALLYIGGNIPDDLVEENNIAWSEWMDMLEERGALVEVGAPFAAYGKVITHENMLSDYDNERDSNVSGYTIIKAENMEDAVDLVMSSPQLPMKYGDGSIEIRHLTPMT